MATAAWSAKSERIWRSCSVKRWPISSRLTVITPRSRFRYSRGSARAAGVPGGGVPIGGVAVVVDNKSLASRRDDARDPLAEPTADLPRPVPEAVPRLRDEDLGHLVPEIDRPRH